MRVALATSPGAGEISKDDLILAQALSSQGAVVEGPEWADPAVDWASFDVVAIRTTWDYQFHLAAFQRWVATVAGLTRIENRPELVEWNIHKSYLLELGAKGVPIVPTHVVTTEIEARLLLEETEKPDWVIKPEVGASGGDTYRTRELGSGGAAECLLQSVAKGKTLVQDYMASIETEGEFSLIWIDGRVVHAVRKTPGDGQFLVHIEHGGRNERVEILAEGEAIARQCIGALSIEPTFARVDLVRDGQGALRLMELELIEPELMFEWAPESAIVLAKALLAPSSI